jgi:hypothetical protein
LTMDDEKARFVTFCGLHCTDCYACTGRIALLAKELRSLLQQYNFAAVSEVVPFDGLQHYAQADAFLEALTFMRCEKACRDGGGNPACEIRACCEGKSFAGCWECGKMEECELLKVLVPIHRDANIKNLRNIKKEGIDKWVKSKQRYG